MRLTALQVWDFRIVARAALEPCAELNVITGVNGAGKTSLLDSIHFLATGRSFTGARPGVLVRGGGGPLRVTGRVSAGTASGEHRLGVERGARGGAVLRLDGANVRRMAELARQLPVVVVHPGSHELIAGGPAERRRLLDQGLFHVEPGFHGVWQRYRRMLAQRNALIRAGRPDRELGAWDRELAAAGAELDVLREGYVASLAECVAEMAPEIWGTGEVAVEYRRGWRAGQTLLDALMSGRNRDRERFSTQQGPHRADLVLQVDGADVRQRVSRGQQKLLAYLLRLAQVVQFRRAGGDGCVLLLDDLPAELDAQRAAAVLRAASGLGAQAFISSLDGGALTLPAGAQRKVFHVEQGRVHEVIQ